MHEFVYVLSVEALVFAALCTLLLARRLNVFEWPADRTWPVFGSSVQALLLFSAALQLVCCFLAAGGFATVAPGIRDACARSAGRLCTAALLCAVYVGVLAATYETDQRSCVLCQLWGTSCSQPDTLFSTSSYAVFLAVLLPATVLQAGLLITAAGGCTLKDHRASRRLVTANCALVLTFQVNYSLRENAALLSHCGNGLRASNASKFVYSVRVWAFAGLLFSLDMLAEMQASLRHASVRPFAFLRALQLSSAVAFNALYDDESLPWSLLYAHLGVSCVLALLDVFELHSFLKLSTPSGREAGSHEAGSHSASQPASHPASHPASQASVAALQHTVLDMPPPAALRDRRSAFEIEPARRRRFVLSFDNKARWPGSVAAPAKKSE